MGSAPLLLAPIDRAPSRRVARGSLVESSAERRLHAGRIVERRTLMGSGRAVLKHEHHQNCNTFSRYANVSVCPANAGVTTPPARPTARYPLTDQCGAIA